MSQSIVEQHILVDNKPVVNPEWLKLRQEAITATDAIKILGKGVIGKQDLFNSKIYRRHNEYTNKYMEWGTEMEPVARKLYESVNETTVLQPGFVKHRNIPWLASSPDGVTDTGILLEIKCVVREIPKLPDLAHMIQVQLNLEVLDLDIGHLFYCRGTLEEKASFTSRKLFVMLRDRDWFKDSLPDLQSFWKDISDGRKFVESL